MGFVFKRKLRFVPPKSPATLVALNNCSGSFSVSLAFYRFGARVVSRPWVLCVSGIKVVVPSDICIIVVVGVFGFTFFLECSSKKRLGIFYKYLDSVFVSLGSGHRIVLKLVGVGYRARVDAGVVFLSLGYSHSVNISIPRGLGVVVRDSGTVLCVAGNSGVPLQSVSGFAALLKKQRVIEIYKGKGVYFFGDGFTFTPKKRV
jgi:hypothetical protein